MQTVMGMDIKNSCIDLYLLKSSIFNSGCSVLRHLLGKLSVIYFVVMLVSLHYCVSYFILLFKKQLVRSSNTQFCINQQAMPVLACGPFAISELFSLTLS